MSISQDKTRKILTIGYCWRRSKRPQRQKVGKENIQKREPRILRIIIFPIS